MYTLEVYSGDKGSETGNPVTRVHKIQAFGGNEAIDIAKTLLREGESGELYYPDGLGCGRVQPSQ